MHEKVDSGAVRGYSPDQQYHQRQQPQGAVVYERYATAEQITAQYQQPLQQYQHVQPVQPSQQYGKQAGNFQPYQEPVYQRPAYQQPQPVQRKGGGVADFFKRRDVVVLIGAVLCTVWLLISYNIIGDMLNAAPIGDTAEELGAAVGTAIGAAMTIPFFILAFIGQVFNWVAWLTSRKGFALTAGILYCVSLLFGFSYGLGMIPCIVLAFVGYARLKKRQ